MKRLCVIPGDGIGQEVIPAAVRVLQEVIPNLDLEFADAGFACFQNQGNALPEATVSCLQSCGAGLFGATSSPSVKVEGYQSPILGLRQSLDLFANLRPVFSLPGISPRQDLDLMIVRENTEGLYVRKERMEEGRAVAERIISQVASRRIGEVALRLADARKQRLTLVHKANVLPVSDGLFRTSVREVSASPAFCDVEIDELLVDVAALKLVEEPDRFDVLVMPNLYGDILSDLASYWMGGMGMAPSLNMGERLALAEPVHGSAPDIAGWGVANPLAAMLSAALLVRYHWQLEEEAGSIESAVKTVLAELGTSTTPTTDQWCDAVIRALKPKVMVS